MINEPVCEGFLASARINNKKWHALAIAVVAVVAEVVYRVDMLRNGQWDWMESVPGRLSWVGWLETGIHLTTVYFVLGVLVFGTITISNLLPVLKRNVRPQYLHPDGCVGIESVVDLLTSFGNIVLLLVMEFGLTIMDARKAHQETLFHVVVFSFGVFALPLLMFVALRAVHEQLKSEKLRLMRMLNYCCLNLSAAEGLENSELGRPAAFEDLCQLAKADDISRAIEAIPTWPLTRYKAAILWAKFVVAVAAFVASLAQVLRL